jgi:flagellar hook-associated protein FlgK
LDNLNPATADLTGLKDEIQSRLQALDGGSANITVDIDNATGRLTVTDAAHRPLTNITLNASPTADLTTVSTGIQLARFSDAYIASTQDGKLVVKSYDSTLSDADIANLILVKADNTQVQADAGITTKQGLIDRINAEQIKTGVVASLDANQDLVLSTTDTKGTREISIGPGTTADGKTVANALGLPAYDYGVTERLQRLLVDDPTKKDIRLSFGSYIAGDPPVKTFGDPANLKTIGLRTGAFIEGGCPDDLLLFVTGKGAANVAVGFSGQPDDLRKTLRTQSLQVKFTAPDRYSIIDRKTGTQLADRNYDPNVLEPMIDFEGLQIKLSHAPAVGDVFQVDGNQDGLANNVNMLDLVDLNKKPVMNGKTIANVYIDQINNVGNLAQQANINQAALTVVNDQAVAARDKVSGVNLDDEAAALIRYQQAYQAAAKALQVSGQLFDAVVQIR